MTSNKQITIVIPFCADCEQRIKNLLAVLHSLEPLACRIIVLEADQQSHISKTIQDNYPAVEFVFQQRNSGVFHRTHYINQLLHMARTPLVGVWDADVIVPLGQINATCDVMSQSEITLAYPYDGRFVALSEKQTDDYINDENCLSAIPQQSILGRPSYGGAYIVNRERYLSLGGENERFVGWGPEDAERHHRCMIMDHKVWRIPNGGLFHLYHPAHASNREIDALRAEFVKVCCMTKEDMQIYIKMFLS